MTEDELFQKMIQLIEDLGWDYDRLSESGKQVYSEICCLIASLTQ